MNQSKHDVLLDSNLADILEIKSNIGNWELIRNSNLSLVQLTSGFGFKIDRSEYDNWKKVASATDSIHVYLGFTQDSELNFYLVDSVTDALGAGNNLAAYKLDVNLFSKQFDEEPSSVGPLTIPSISFSTDGKLSPDEVLSRLMSWKLFAPTWHRIQSKSTTYQPITGGDGTTKHYAGVLKCMSIPFMDLQKLFGMNPTMDSVMAFFALRKNTDSTVPRIEQDILELILCSDVHSGDGGNVIDSFADVTIPVPPYSGDTGYNLF